MEAAWAVWVRREYQNKYYFGPKIRVPLRATEAETMYANAKM